MTEAATSAFLDAGDELATLADFLALIDMAHRYSPPLTRPGWSRRKRWRRCGDGPSG